MSVTVAAPQGSSLEAPSIRSLRDCAAGHLAFYTDPDGPRAFRTYDRLGQPDTLGPLDCLAPALLSVDIDYRQVVPLFRATGPGANLLAAMQAVLDHPDSTDTDFLTVDLNAPGTAWAAVDAALVACRTTARVKWLKEVAVTKILHRKRPALVPIFDSRVYSFYFGQRPVVGTAAVRALFARLQADVAANADWLRRLSAGVSTPDDRSLALLRAADIITWEHQTRPDHA